MPRAFLLTVVLTVISSADALAVVPQWNTAPRPGQRGATSSPAFLGELGDALKCSLERISDWRVARASHILLKDFDEAAVGQLGDLKAEIGEDPKKFAEMAKQHSQCRSSKRGGDLGFFTRGKMVKEFERVVFSEEPGYVYGPVRTDFGNHLIYIHSCRTPQRKGIFSRGFGA